LRGPFLLGADRIDVAEPTADDGLEADAVETIMTAPPLAPDLDEAGLLEDAEVARRRRPAVLEVGREITRRELPAEVAQEQDEVAPRLVSEGLEDEVDVVERGRRGHVTLISHNANN
jgi:hypothetical protein